MSYAMTTAMKNTIIIATIQTFEASPIVYRLGSLSRSHNQKAMDNFAVGAQLLSLLTGETLELTGAQWRALTEWGMDAALIEAHHAGATLVEAYNEEVHKRSNISHEPATVKKPSMRAQFLQCPNGKVWRLIEERQISGIVAVADADEFDNLEQLLDAISDAATGSVIGLTDYSYSQPSPGVFEFCGTPEEWMQADEEDRKAMGYQLLEADDSKLRDLLRQQHSISEDEAAAITSRRGAPWQIENVAHFDKQSAWTGERCIAWGSVLNQTVIHARIGGEIIWAHNFSHEDGSPGYQALRQVLGFLSGQPDTDAAKAGSGALPA